MSKLFIIMLMVFCHIVDDYYLQGILAQMKQRTWWRFDAYDPKFYGKDYLMALAMHGFSWAFMVMLPVAAYQNFDPSPNFYAMFLINWVAHSVIDHMKANIRIINLVQDQLLHIVQIGCTAWLLLR